MRTFLFCLLPYSNQFCLSEVNNKNFLTFDDFLYFPFSAYDAKVVEYSYERIKRYTLIENMFIGDIFRSINCKDLRTAIVQHLRRKINIHFVCTSYIKVIEYSLVISS